MGLPPHFCWTKYGTEAGETTSSILQRKERERSDNGGTFLWGIGNSIRPSLLALLEIESDPQVLFTPMLSKPAFKDTMPAVVGRWTRAVGADGAPWDLPQHSRVTSGVGTGQPEPKRHFALVCARPDPIGAGAEGCLDDNELRNLRTGSVVGASQVTSVVRRVARSSRRERYTVSFQASLVYPYFVTLTGWCPIVKPSFHEIGFSEHLVAAAGA